VTVALLVATAAVRPGRYDADFCTKEAVRIALDGFTGGIACEGLSPRQYLRRGTTRPAVGALPMCLICFDAKHLDGPRW
jgi:hypothetical protein